MQVEQVEAVRAEPPQARFHLGADPLRPAIHDLPPRR